MSVEVGAVVLASGWVPLDEKYLAPMGLGVSPKVVHAAQFGKMLVAGEVTARRIAFVLDTTLAEEAVRKAAEDTRDWQRQLSRGGRGRGEALCQGRPGERQASAVLQRGEQRGHAAAGQHHL